MRAQLAGQPLQSAEPPQQARASPLVPAAAAIASETSGTPLFISGLDGSEAALLPDSEDSVQSFTSQSDSQYHLRLTRSEPDGWGARDFLITPYTYGYAQEYPGVLEFWVHDFSVHMNHRTGSPDEPANFWIGDEQDLGGLYATAHWLGGGPNQSVVLSSDTFAHTSHGPLRFQVRDVTDHFDFEFGPYGSELTKVRVATNEAGDATVDLLAASSHAQLSSSASRFLLGTVTPTPIQLSAGGAAGISVFPSGSTGIGGGPDGAALSVGPQGAFAVSAAGAVTIGGGTSISAHISLSTTLAFGAIAGRQCQTSPVRVGGARDGDVVALGVPAVLAASPSITFFGYVGEADVVMIRACNVADVASAELPSASVRVDLWQHG